MFARYLSELCRMILQEGPVMKPKRRSKEIAFCRVCGEEKMLCTAHLLPDGLRMIIEDFKVPGSTMNQVRFGDTSVLPKQTLLFDRSILCAECDGRFQQADNKLIHLMKRWADLPSRKHSFLFEMNSFRCLLPGRAADLKLGVSVSLLRFSYSEQFDEIKLAPDQEAYILKWARFGGDGQEGNCGLSFRVSGTTFQQPEGSKSDLTRLLQASPFVEPTDGGNIYLFNLFGLTIWCKFGDIWPEPLDGLGRLRQVHDCIEILMLPIEANLVGFALENIRDSLFGGK